MMKFTRALFLISLSGGMTLNAQVSLAIEAAADTTTGRDGQHDFDFEIGTWKIHVSRLQHPLTGSQSWIDLDGTCVVRKLLDSANNVLELKLSNATDHLEGISVQLYNRQTHQWSLNFAGLSDGMFGQPTVGEFKDGRGEFFDQEPYNGKTILLRKVWSNITPNSARFEEAFSIDGGKTWEINWIATETRITDTSNLAH